MSQTKPSRPAAVGKTKPRVAGPFKGQEPLEDKGTLAGTMLSDRYYVMEKIGQGGMGDVYLAEDSRLGKKVAIKVLPGYFLDAPEVARRFIQEARVAPRIEHENIIDVTDLGSTGDGVPFFVMEYLKGSDLSKAISRDGPMSWGRKAREITLQMCRALGAAHQKGIIHRDMKPENVFLLERSDGSAFIKIFDFGIAKLLEQAHMEEVVVEPLEAGERRSRATRAGSVIGTPSYMAPEQARGDVIDQRVDVYAVGTMMYEMLSGHVPFELAEKEGPLADSYKILDMQKNQEPEALSARFPALNVPADVEAVIMKALRKDPAERYQSTKELEDAVSACDFEAEEQPSQTMTSPTPVKKTVRPGILSMQGYQEIMKADASRRAKRLRLIAAGVALSLASAGAALGYDYVRSVYHLEKLRPPGIHSVDGAHAPRHDGKKKR